MVGKGARCVHMRRRILVSVSFGDFLLDYSKVFWEFHATHGGHTMSAVLVPMRAMVPKELRRQAKMVLASKEVTFTDWFREHLERWLQEEGSAERPPMAG